MCGIFGYIGTKNASEVVLEGLKRLEYRGYDSWGIAVLSKKGKGKREKPEIKVAKNVGAIGDLTDHLPLITLQSHVGIGHTRWATHGGISETNAHPHFSSDKSFVLAQNGIVENYSGLKNGLIKRGYKFETETDTEVIVRLIEDKLRTLGSRPAKDGRSEESNHLKDAARLAFLELKGRNTIIILTKDGQIIAARNGSPLVVGVNREEIFFSSDTLSFAPFVNKVAVIDNGQMVYYNGKLNVTDIKSNKHLAYHLEKIDFKSSKVDKEGYDHFMLKEIHESPHAVNQVIVQPDQNLKIYQSFIQNIKNADSVYTIGSGTAGIAAAQMAFYLRTFGKIKAISLIGAEAYEYFDLFTKKDLVIAPSQSGETADVLEVLEIIKNKGIKIASYVNMPGATMTRLSDYKFMVQACPEICVMATKTFASKLAWGYLISKMVSNKQSEAQKNLRLLSDRIEKYLNTDSNHQLLKTLAEKLSANQHIFLLGKYQNFNIVREGMVKIIEASYIHAHGIPAGDLKHYAITLIEKGVPVIIIVSEDAAKDDVINAVNQVKARGAEVIGISPKPHASFDHHIPVADTGETAAIMNIIPLQLLAYYMAVALGRNVDKPRNIAKSVTVK